MRIMAGVCMAAVALGLWGTAAGAEDAWIRVEAKRGAAAEAALAEWRERFPDAVAFPVARGMKAIVLGPQSPAAAARRMAELKAKGTIPADSYLTGPGGDKPLAGLAEALAAPAAEQATDTGATPAADQAAPATDAADAPEPQATAPAQAHVQLQATPGSVSAREALADWRRTFPEAQLFRLPGGWFAVALPPLPEAEAQARLRTLVAAGRAPRDAFLTPAARMGTRIDPPAGEAVASEPAPATAADRAAAEPQATGATPPSPTAESPAAADEASATGTGTAAETPPAPLVMPPAEDVQRILRWAGRYEGPIDGQAGSATRAAIEAEIAATGGSASPEEAIDALIAKRAAWRAQVGLDRLTDAATGLSLTAPVGSLAFDRTERALSIYGPKDGSGAALILFAQPGGQQELSDLAGLVTALGWVPSPTRDMGKGRFTLTGANALHAAHAEGRLRDGIAEGWVLIWPAQDAETARRLAVEAADSFMRVAPPAAPDPSQNPNPAGASGPGSTRTGAAAAPRP